MKHKTVVSIVTPSFRQAQFIDKTLASVFQQQGEFFLDYIVQDGGSEDGTKEILKRWEATFLTAPVVHNEQQLLFRKSPEIGCLGLSFRWWSEKDGGQSEAINLGFSRAIGEWGGWLNSDDYFEVGAIERARLFQGQRPRVVFGDCLCVDQDGKPQGPQVFRSKYFTLYHILYDRSPPQPSVFFPLDLYRQVGELRADYHYELDKDLWIRMLKTVKRFEHDNFFYSTQIYHPASKSMGGDRPFALFSTEHDAIHTREKQNLGWIRPWYELRSYAQKAIGKVRGLGRRLGVRS
jgi:glycosyltransferase involved in cell wall biosynthesis